MPAFSLPPAPVALVGRPSLLAERSPTTPARPEAAEIHGFGTMLSPVKFSAQGH